MNTSRCRLEVYKTRSSLSGQVSEKEAELAACRAKLQQCESEVNQLLSEIQRTETKNSKSKVIRPSPNLVNSEYLGTITKSSNQVDVLAEKRHPIGSPFSFFLVFYCHTGTQSADLLILLLWFWDIFLCSAQ